MQHGTEAISLWLSCGVIALIASFRSFALLSLESLIFLLSQRFSEGLGPGQFAAQSSTTIPGSLNKPLAIQTLLETEHIISIQPVSRRNFEVFLFFLVLGCINWTKKPIWATLVDHMSPHSIIDCGNFILLSLLLVHLFLPQVFLPLSLLWICTDTPFCKKPTSLAINFCSLPSLWRVSLASSWTSA